MDIIPNRHIEGSIDSVRLTTTQDNLVESRIFTYVELEHIKLRVRNLLVYKHLDIRQKKLNNEIARYGAVLSRRNVMFRKKNTLQMILCMVKDVRRYQLPISNYNQNFFEHKKELYRVRGVSIEIFDIMVLTDFKLHMAAMLNVRNKLIKAYQMCLSEMKIIERTADIHINQIYKASNTDIIDLKKRPFMVSTYVCQDCIGLGEIFLTTSTYCNSCIEGLIYRSN